MDTLINTLIKKINTLKRRKQQAIRSLKKADEAYELKNIELWEAYETCVKYQQDRMFELIKDIMILQIQDQKRKGNYENSNRRDTFKPR